MKKQNMRRISHGGHGDHQRYLVNVYYELKMVGYNDRVMKNMHLYVNEI